MIKKTSFEYGQDHQERMLNYYYQSKNTSIDNNEYLRVNLAGELVELYLRELHYEVNRSEIIIADIGCSVGLMAIEFAKKGFRAFGYDFDPAAIQIAKKLADEEEAKVNFYQHDVSSQEFESPIDIAVCFDIFEHLHDDEIGVLLYNLKKRLTKNGCIVFHTLPLQYDYIFWDNKRGIIKFPFALSVFKKQAPQKFEKKVKIYALIKDIMMIYRENAVYRESIKKSGHPNPLTKQRLKDIIERAGYEIRYLKSGFLGESQLDTKDKKYFLKHEITHRSMYGIIVPERNK